MRAAGRQPLRQPPRSARRRSRHGRAPRNLRTEDLLLTIELWLGEVGAVNFSLRAAADAAGVSATTLLRHFGSRERLLAALLRHRARHNIAGLRKRVERHNSFIAALRDSLAQPTLPQLQEARIVVQLIAIAQFLGQDTRFADLFGIRDLQGEVAELIAADGVPAPEAAGLAHYLLATTFGFVMSYANDGNEDAFGRNYRRLYRHVVAEIERAAGLSAGPGA